MLIFQPMSVLRFWNPNIIHSSQTMLESSQECFLVFCSICWILWGKKRLIATTKDVVFHFHFQSAVVLRTSLVEVTFKCVLVCCRKEWLWLGVPFIDVCMYVSHLRGLAHMLRARPRWVCRWKEQHAVCVGKARIVMNTLFHGCLSRRELWESRLWGLIKLNSCWFVMGEESWRLEVWESSEERHVKMCTELRKVTWT